MLFRNPEKRLEPLSRPPGEVSHSWIVRRDPRSVNERSRTLACNSLRTQGQVI